MSAARPARLPAIAAVTIALCAALFGFAVQPATALAAPADAWYSISVTLYDLDPGKTPTLVVSGLLPEGTATPVDAALPIPKGSSITWAGELLGGNPANDPLLDYTVVEGEAYDLVQFTVTEGPAARLELAVPDGMIVDAAGGRRIAVEWVSAGSADGARIGIASPLDQHLVDVTPEPIVEVRNADVLYAVEILPLSAGQTLSLSGTLVPGTASELDEMMGSQETTPAEQPALIAPIQNDAEAETDDGDSAIRPVWFLIGGLIVLLGAAVALLVKRLRAERTES